LQIPRLKHKKDILPTPDGAHAIPNPPRVFRTIGRSVIMHGRSRRIVDSEGVYRSKKHCRPLETTVSWRSISEISDL
jgi:hypothetical protein